MSSLTGAWLVLACAFTFVALVRLSLARHRPKRSESAPCRVVLVRPVDAPTSGELEALRIVPDGVEAWVVSPEPLEGLGPTHVPSTPRAANRKLGHLQHALTLIPEDAIVLTADADVQLDAGVVRALVISIQNGAALSWAAPRPEAKGLTRGLLVQSMHSFEVLDVMSLGAPAVCGKVMALGPAGRAALAALPDCIGEDLELSRVLHRAGERVEQVGYALVRTEEPPLRAVAARFTRWMQVLKAHRPALFPSVPLLFACTPVLAVLTALVRSPSVSVGFGILVLLRATMALSLERQPRPYVAWFFAEALLLWCWLRALVSFGHVTWRGRRLEVSAHGRVREGNLQ